MKEEIEALKFAYDTKVKLLEEDIKEAPSINIVNELRIKQDCYLGFVNALNHILNNNS